MTEHTRQGLLMQGLGTNTEVMAELYPRFYLALLTVLAVIGYACLLLFPALALAGVSGIVLSLAAPAGIDWAGLLLWSLAGGFGVLVSYRLAQIRPAPPSGIMLDKKHAPSLFQLVTDTVEHYGAPAVGHVVVTGAYQLDIVNTPRWALPVGASRTLVIGLPLLQCLSATRFDCLLARRIGQSSGRTNRLVNRLNRLREIWPRYRAPEQAMDIGYLPVRLLFSLYVPLYNTLSTAVVRLDELHADSYAMELFSDEEVLDTITADTVYRLFLRERYWPAVRKLDGDDAAAVTKSPMGMMRVLCAGLKADTVGEWVERAMSTEHRWDDLCPSLVRRLDNIGHVHARMDDQPGESAAEAYLSSLRPYLGAAIENLPPPRVPHLQSWSVQWAGMQRSLQFALQRLVQRRKYLSHTDNGAPQIRGTG